MTSNTVFFPPEWAPQAAVLIAWPQQTGDFAPWLAEVEDNYAQIAAAISARQTLIILYQDAAQQQHALNYLAMHDAVLENIRWLECPFNDIWVRDTAPLTVLSDQQPLLLDFRFNGWGNKHNHALDAQLAAKVINGGIFQQPHSDTVEMVLEGGSVETDGHGTLLTTRYCLLNPNRNPEWSQERIETELKQHLGLKRILWINHGHIEGDDTDAHIDTLARFCDANTIAYTACDDPDDAHYTSLQAMAEELRQFTSYNGEPYRLIALPIPKAIYAETGERLPATYANFLIINDTVLVPVYDDEQADRQALTRLSSAFPEHTIVPVPCRGLIRQFGSLHCMTMQFPLPLSLTR